MLDALEATYRHQGILATDFRCPLAASCGAGQEGFTQAKSAFVSRGYAKHDLPRLLFLSLDPGSSREGGPRDPAAGQR
jgi:hypothetical protein